MKNILMELMQTLPAHIALCSGLAMGFMSLPHWGSVILIALLLYCLPTFLEKCK